MSQRIHALLFICLLQCSACNLQAEVITRSGAFPCEQDSQCPEGLACHSYLDVYTRYIDSKMQSTAQGFWGICILESDWELVGRDHPLESCMNGRDDDDDGAADCADPDCQTAPHCRDWGQLHCEGTAPSEFCETRLGFPTVRGGQTPDETTCPLGSAVVYSTADDETYCLPRCRLLFPRSEVVMTPHAESIFSGSDAYCDAVGPPWATHASFSGPLACQHLGVFQNNYNQNFQEDVCLPKNADLVTDGPTSETCLSVCGGAACLQVSHPRRDLSVMNFMTGQVKPITGTDPNEYTRTSFYCLD